MKARFTYFVLLLFFISINGLHAQSGLLGRPVVSFQPNGSPLFGKDIVINDQPNQDQRTVALCSAFNGWLFSVYSYVNNTYNVPCFTIMKSIDNGISWTVFYDGLLPYQDCRFTSLDIVTIGDSVSNLKVFLAGVNKNGPWDDGEAAIYRFNGETGDFEERLLEELGVYDIAIATDYGYPANNSYPSSLGVVYSKYSNNKDSVIFRSSSNGGMSLDNRKTVAISGNRFHKVSLTYGRSSTFSNGNYYAAWEEHADYGSIPGHIYTAHTNPNFNSPFTTPINLDSLNAVNINMCKNPTIACQNNNIDNDSANLSEIVLFDKYNQSNQSYDIKGYYNLQAANHTRFQNLTFSNSLHNNMQSDIKFNPYNSTFMLTYFDSTEKKLPFLTNDVNLTNPNSWNVISQSYNDNSNLISPNPKVKINFEKQDGMNIWISEGTSGNGIAMFDAPYSTWTGVQGDRTNYGTRLISAYPNPCNTNTTIRFELQKADIVNISICNLVGQPVRTLTEQFYPSGTHELKCNISNLSPGSYIVKLLAGDFQSTGKLMVIR